MTIAGGRRGRAWLELGFGLGLVLALASCSGPPAATTTPSATPLVLPTGDVLAQASARIAAQSESAVAWAGPSGGPRRARPSGRIVFVAADMTNGGIAGAYDGVQLAARAMGWTVSLRDGQATVEGRAAALEAAIAEQPIGIIIGGFDPGEQADLIHEAREKGIPLVGWHAGAQPGPDAAGLLFTNISTQPSDVALLAADYVINVSHGTAGVAIFTDSQYQIALDKADLMKAEIERCTGCKVLAYRDTPIVDATARMPTIVSDLRSQFGSELTYLLAINGNYFAGSRLGLMSAHVGPTDPPWAVAAGDGDQKEFDRIRASSYQLASVAEPLHLQGWQMVDELNRALAGTPPSGFLAPPGLITLATVPASGRVWDPTSSYATTYERIWGVGQ